MKRITIYEVAKEAEVSLATVSRVINGSNVVREDTRKKVEEVIKRLGYKPNAIAQGLALQKTTTIALIISDNSVYNTGQTLSGLTDVAKIYKYNISLHTISEGLNSMNEAIDAVIKSRADGAIIFDDKFTQEQLNLLQEYGLPVVTVGKNSYRGDTIGNVYISFEKMAYEIAKKYIEKGKKDIVLIEDRKNAIVMESMNEGISKAFKEAGLSFNGFINIPKEHRASYTYLKKYFEENTHDLVIAYRDSQAIAVVNSLNEANKMEQVEVICALDTKYNGMVRPPISGYKIPQYDLGAVAMRVLTKMLALNGAENEEEVDFEKDIELGYLYTKRSTTME